MLRNDKHELRVFIEHNILQELNKIYGRDGCFKRIMSLERPRGSEAIKEIFLEDRNGIPIPLSKMGSGAKTVLLVLLCIHVVPRYILNKPLEKIFFCFEEIENNLHPAIQRRLFSYLNDIIQTNSGHLFLTTHSHVPINMFCNDENFQLLHVTQQAGDPSLSRVDSAATYIHHGRIFDDLEVRASDLLQSNCIIWVEGPSDRIYFNRWIELVDKSLKEHVDFEYAFTAGTLLSHFTFDDPDDSELIEALRINRNAIILMDRDFPRDSEKYKARVERVRKEFEGQGGIAWVTEGKEVENYIPINVLQTLLDEPNLAHPGSDENIVAFIQQREGFKSLDKVTLAMRVCNLLDESMMASFPEWRTQMKQVCRKIREWNSPNSPSIPDAST
jgi:putative ATP-dependent endonuclease of the OLD family